jgi:hypothetical protein
VSPQIVLTPCASRDLAHLPEGLAPDGGLDPDLGADGGPVGDDADKAQDEPAVWTAVIAVEEGRFRIIKPIHHEKVQIAVVVIVTPGTKCRPAAVVDYGPFGHLREGSVAIVPEEEIVLPVIGDEEIDITVIVVVAPNGAM